MRWIANEIDCDVLKVDPFYCVIKSDENVTKDVFMYMCLKLAK